MTTSNASDRKGIVIHPFLLALYPILFLAAHNAEELPLDRVLLPLAVSLGIAALLFGLFYLLLRNGAKAGIIVSLLSVCFYAYGHVQTLLHGVRIGPLEFGGQRFFRIGWMLGFALLLLLVARMRATFRPVTTFLNVVSAVLVITSLVTLLPQMMRSHGDTAGQIAAVPELPQSQLDSLPDIYFIVLDGHASQRTLQRYYGYDNVDFISHLRRSGFYIADDSHSNYPHTILSLAATLNMRYMESPGEGVTNANTMAVKMVANNKVAQELRGRGYRYVHFSTGWAGTNASNVADTVIECGDVREFYTTLVETTLLHAFQSSMTVMREQERQGRLAIMEHLMTMRREKQPRFVLAHILLPHPPFIFDAEGNHPHSTSVQIGNYSAWKDKEGYIGQLKFVDRMIGDVVDSLLANVSPRPIIIIQGDHGPASFDQWENPGDDFINERFGILNAMYLPGDGEGTPYPSISSVNTFPLIFNRYFGGNYTFLPDRSFFSRPEENMVLTEVTGRLYRTAADSTRRLAPQTVVVPPGHREDTSEIVYAGEGKSQ